MVTETDDVQDVVSNLGRPGAGRGGDDAIDDVHADALDVRDDGGPRRGLRRFHSPRLTQSCVGARRRRRERWRVREPRDSSAPRRERTCRGQGGCSDQVWQWRGLDYVKKTKYYLYFRGTFCAFGPPSWPASSASPSRAGRIPPSKPLREAARSRSSERLRSKARSAW